jgi:hypothetical protein
MDMPLMTITDAKYKAILGTESELSGMMPVMI